MRKITSPSGIPFAWLLRPEQYQENFVRNANQIEAQLIVDWEDAGTLKHDLMESCVYVPGQSWLQRTTPYACPEATNSYLLGMRKIGQFLNGQAVGGAPNPLSETIPPQLPQRDYTISTSPATNYGYPVQTYDPKTGWYAFDRIAYNCTFGNLPYKVKTDDQVKGYTIPELERYAVFTKLPQTLNRRVSTAGFQLERANAPITSEVGTVPETTTVLMVRQWMWPKAAIPWPAIYDRSGKINSVDITIDGELYPAETLRYDGLSGSPEEYTGVDGTKYVDLAHKFVRHPVNWNKVYDPGQTPPWTYAKIAGIDPPQRRFLTASFAEIFKPL